MATNPTRSAPHHDVATLLRRFRSIVRIQFPLLLDDYVMREYATNFAIVLSSFSTLFLIFTFFELIGHIFRNRTPLITVGEYLVNLIPYILYNITPLCALVAVLVTFGSLSRTSELTAMKSSGISLYRIITPVLVVTMLISAGLFAFDELYLPAANRRQEALLSIIKDKPAQTFSPPRSPVDLGPDRQRRRTLPHLLLPVSSTQRKTPSPISPSSSSTQPHSRFSDASSPQPPNGIPKSTTGSSTTAGNAHSPAKPSPAINPSP